MRTSDVAVHLELEKNRGYWRAKGYERKATDLTLTRGEDVIRKERGRWCLYEAQRGRVKAEPMLYTLLKTTI
ncbi:creatininase [Klebsiella oxytoca]|uniref:creatininase n=1 Tax=Klebsiella aerogenes TaxID=548 RepID=UPI0027E87F3C|nr:creatininase [Klebsiella aerogenes]HDT4319344.1 creatininase [Klebsiella aerogenes]HDT5519362.1 creatininase [Klebsiella aerogenes]